MTFNDSFFSVAGQKERLANAGNTLLSAVGIKGGGVQSNTGVKVLDSVLSAGASHPFLTAGAVATAINPTGAVAGVKAVGGVVSAEFSKLSLGAKAVTVVSTPVVASALLSSSTLRSSVASTPSALVNFGSNIGNLADNPSISNLTKIAKDNPLISGLAVATGLVATGGAVRGVAGIIAIAQNTSAIKESNKMAEKVVESAVPLTPSITSSPVGTPILAPPVSTSSVTPRRNVGGARRRRKAKEPQRIVNNVRVYNIDDRDNVDRKVYKGRSQYA